LKIYTGDKILKALHNKLTIKTFFMSDEDFKSVSDNNREFAQRYIKAVENDARVTSQKTIDYNVKIMGFLLRHIKTDLDKLTVDDIDDIQSAITNWRRVDGSDVAASTKQQYRIGVKRFFHWIAERYEQPKYDNFAKLIKLRSGANAPKKKHEELFTKAEIEKMIAAADNIRDQAIIATLYESGCRAGELLSCKVKNVTFNGNGCKLTITGKTGTRTVDLVLASPYIDHYLRAMHQEADNPEAALWVAIYHKPHDAITYSGLDILVKKIGRAAGIKKRVHLHNFRHTAATQLASVWTEPVMKQYLGWSANSNMPSIYISLSGEDMEAAVLSDRYGIVEKKQNDKGLEIGKCPKCWKTLPSSATFCYNCGMPLTKEAQHMHDDKLKEAMAIIAKHPDAVTTYMANAQQK
jgi:integrase/recombinase XerD